MNNFRTGKIVLVVGMHRSGTSMLAEILHSSGISMGRCFRPCLPENPRGFFEEEAFRRFNDALLAASSYVVKEWCLDFRGLKPTAADLTAARSLLLEFGSRGLDWGWKDPRSCLTLSFWLSALKSAGLLPRARLVLITRDFSSVAKSLQRRRNVDSQAAGVALCRLYSREVEAALANCRPCPPVLRVRYERLLQGLDIAELEEFCGRRLSTSAIDVTLDRCGPDRSNPPSRSSVDGLARQRSPGREPGAR